MKLASSLRSAGTMLFATLALTPFVDARHEKNLPAETYGIVQVLDVADLQKRWDKHPLKADIEKAKLEEFFAPGIQKMEKEMSEDKKSKEAKKVLESLKKHLNGEVLFAVVKTPKTEKGHAPYDYVWFVDTSADEKTIGEMLEDCGLLQDEKGEVSETAYNISTGKSKGGDEMIEDEEEEEKVLEVITKKISEKYKGVTLHSREVAVGKDDPVNLGGWALVDKTFVYASAPNVLKELIDAVQGGRKDSFADTAIWKRNRGDMGKPDSLVFLNCGLTASTLREFVVEQTKDAPPNMFGVNYLQAYDALGLDVWDAMWISKTLESEQVSFKSAFSYSEKKGLLSLMTYKPLDTLVPAYIPAGASTFSVSRMDMSEAWANLEALLAKAAPALKPMLDMQINNLKTQQGIDLRDGLLQNFGEELVVIGEFGSNSGQSNKEIPVGNMLYVIGLKDQAKMEALLATALGKIPSSESLFDEREFMGVKIRRFKNQQAGGEEMAESMANSMPYFAVHNGRFFFGQGESKILEKVVAEMKDGRNPVSKDVSVQQAMKLVPKNVVSFSYTDVASYLDYISELVSYVSKNEGEKIVDPSKKPSPDDIPWVMSGYSEERANEISSQGVLFRKKK
ncbi:MAG: DUF3352 domain-containing protein [Puniceicoccales bacterium]|jgi:hypothetical protein|nr:DUF3352 domain-containing protein [Puniceicoccales bacterium]